MVVECQAGRAVSAVINGWDATRRDTGHVIQWCWALQVVTALFSYDHHVLCRFCRRYAWMGRTRPRLGRHCDKRYQEGETHPRSTRRVPSARPGVRLGVNQIVTTLGSRQEPCAVRFDTGPSQRRTAATSTSLARTRMFVGLGLSISLASRSIAEERRDGFNTYITGHSSTPEEESTQFRRE